jgi:S-adenosylmethionine synthetase
MADELSKADALLESEIHHESGEYKRGAHPDFLSDSIVLRAGAALLKLDSSARFDMKVKITFGDLDAEKGGEVFFSMEQVPVASIGGQVASSVPKEIYLPAISNAVRHSFRLAGYNAENCFAPEDIIVIRNFNRQSEDIIKGIERGGGEKGAGDATIVHGYASSQTKEGFSASWALPWAISNLLDESFRAGSINGLWPDGKVQADVLFGGCFNAFPVEPLRAENVVVAAQHKPGVDFGAFKDRVVQLVRSANDLIVSPEGKPLNLIDSKTEIVVDGAGEFSKGGIIADSGQNGAIDTLHVSGGTRKYGAGLLVGRDVTKTDLSCQLIARNLALYLVRSGIAREAAVSITYYIGSTKPSSLSVSVEGCNYSGESLARAILETFDLSPAGMEKHLDLTHCDFEAIAAKGFFGVAPNSSHQWERVSPVKLSILRQNLAKYSTLPANGKFNGQRTIAAPVR